MKKVIQILYFIGLVIICSLYTPIFIKYGREHIIFSHIFSTSGDIIIPRLMLYFFLWTGICLALFFQFKDLKLKIPSFKIKKSYRERVNLFFKELDFKYNLTGNKEYLKYKAEFKKNRPWRGKYPVATFKKMQHDKMIKKAEDMLAKREAERNLMNKKNT